VLAGGASFSDGEVRSGSSRPGCTRSSTLHQRWEELGFGALEADGRQLAQANVVFSCWRILAGDEGAVQGRANQLQHDVSQAQTLFGLWHARERVHFVRRVAASARPVVRPVDRSEHVERWLGRPSLLDVRG